MSPPAPRHDPSSWRDRAALAALATVGLAISVYLTAYQVGAMGAPWDPIFGSASSARVLRSALSRALPVPDAALGALAYLGEIVTGLAGGDERWRTRPWVVLAFGALAAGLGLASIGLIAMQALVLHAGCTLCLASAAVSITVAVSVIVGGEIAAAWRTLGAGARERRGAGCR